MRVAQVGYGEVGGIFGAALAKDGCEVTAYDIRIADSSWASSARARAERDGVALAPRLEDALSRSELVISAVTAAATLEAAGQVSRVGAGSAWFLDVNSASPQTKSACAEAVNGAGARYVEAAVMTAVPPYGLKVPMLLGGPHAEALQPTLARLGFEATTGSPEYGVVSAIKLCRSIFIKGFEAIAVEGLLTARRHGVEAEVLASLAETFPGIDWNRQVTYFWRRVVQHGKRRAEEMREAAVTVAGAEVPSHMAAATSEVQAWVAKLAAEGAFADAPKDGSWRDLADRVPRS